jgi:hypothetical protein
MAASRSQRRPPLSTKLSIERANKREDVWMKAARREALEQQTRERQVWLVMSVIGALASLALMVTGHPVWALGGVATGLAHGASGLRRAPHGADASGSQSTVGPPVLQDGDKD